MLSEEEKKEMLEDANDMLRRDSLRFARENFSVMSFDEYLVFLDEVQKVFFPFKNLKKITQTELNKL